VFYGLCGVIHGLLAPMHGVCGGIGGLEGMQASRAARTLVSDLRMTGALYYVMTLLGVSLKVVLFTNFYTGLLFLSVAVGVVAWFVFYVVLGDFGETQQMLSSPLFWLSLLLVPVLVSLRDFLWRFYRRQFRPHPYHIVQERCAIERRRFKQHSKSRLSIGDGDGDGDRDRDGASRGFTFIQTPGQSEMLKAYR